MPPKRLRPFFVLIGVAIASIPLGIIALLFNFPVMTMTGIVLISFGAAIPILLLSSCGWNARHQRTNNPFLWWLIYERFMEDE